MNINELRLITQQFSENGRTENFCLHLWQQPCYVKQALKGQRCKTLDVTSITRNTRHQIVGCTAYGLAVFNPRKGGRGIWVIS